MNEQRRNLAGMRRLRKAKKVRPDRDEPQGDPRRFVWEAGDLAITPALPSDAVARHGTSVAWPTADPKLLRVVDGTGREAVVRRDVLAKMGWPV